MKKVLLLMLVCALGFTAFGQTKIGLRATDKAVCVKSDYTSLKASFSFSGIEAYDFQSERGMFSELDMPNTVIGGNEGDPQIPVVNQLIAVPFGAHPRIEVKSYSSTDYRLEDYGIHKLMPRQLPVRKSQRPEDVPFIYNAAAYQKEGLAMAPQANVSVVGTMRGVQLGKMGIEPVSYDPVNNTLRVFNDIEVEVYFDDADAQATEDMLVSTYSPYFEIVYKQLFNGRAVLDAYSSHPDLYTTPAKMLVITTSTYANTTAFQNWKNWKQQKGIAVDVQTVTSSTSASSIRSTIQSKYNANHPTFLVIVGDKQDVTSYETYTESGNSYNPYDSDLKYASMDNDVYHDMFMSRMPISSTTELSNLLTKIMQYEQYTMPDPSYLNNVLLIAGQDNTWASKVGRPTINYAADNYFNTAHGFSNVYKYVTSTYTNCYSYLSSGVGFANYTAHGDITMWYQPQFTTSNVSSLTNTNKYFWAMGNCCLAANWGYSASTPCLAEALLRAANKGAFGYIGSIPETLWYEDYYFGVGATKTFNATPSMSATTTGVYDAMFDDTGFNTLNSVPYIGNVAVTYAHANNYTSSVDDQYYWRAYQCLGDGSVMPYHVNPSANTVSHANTLQTGATSFTVSAVAGSYVAITVNNQIIGVAQVPSSGTVNVPITAQNATGTARIVVTRQQRQPYIQDITITSNGGSTTTYYNITATANPTAGGTISGTGSYASGSTCTLTANPAAGYEFSHWTKNGTQVSTNATYSFSVTANASYVANFVEAPQPTTEDVTVGSGTSTNAYIPTYAYYKYSLTEQIYTPSEIGQAGTITAIAYKVSNSKSATRTIDLYMKHTSNSAFASKTGWESLSSSNKVFSGSVTFNASGWTTITLSTPFEYNGTSNLLIGMDDNTGSYVSSSSNSPQFYVYSTSANRALRIYNDNTNYNPASPSSYSGNIVTSNNQIKVSKSYEAATVNTYTITATANPAAGGTVTGTGTYDEGSTVTLTATPATGYTFSKWTKNGSQVSTNATYSFTATADAAYVAVFTLSSYTISASASPAAGGTVNGAGTYNYGSTCTLTATANNGYTFSKWTKNGTQVSTNASYSFTVTANATYVAQFVQNAATTYTITASANPSAGGTVTGAGTYNENTSCTLKATPASGYEFVNWTKNGSVVSTNAQYTFSVTASAAYVANFNSTATPVVGGDITIGSGTSTNKYLPTYTYYKYSFSEQIYTAAEIGQAGTITAIAFKVSNSKSATRTVDLYMKHTSKSTFSSKTDWESLSSSNKVFSGSVNFNASGWTTITLSTPFEYNGTSNLLIGFDDNTGSYISSSASPQFYVYSTSANRALRVYSDGTNYTPASPSSYSGTLVTSNNQIMLTMSGSAPVVVNNYTITATANPTAGGTVSGAGTYQEGSTATLKATAASGYTFSKWTKNGTQVSTNASYSFTVTGNAAYVANFDQVPVVSYYNITVASLNGGTITANKTTASEGEVVTLTATPASNYTFDRWVVYKTGNVNVTLTVSNNKFTMPAYDVTVAAVFKPTGTGSSSSNAITIGSGTSTNKYIPTYTYYKYSFSEQIYTAAEIGQAGTITAIAFKVSNSKSTSRTVDLYMKHTSKSAFSSKTDWETLSSSNKVYSGSVTFNASGWTTITLNTPFAYNGTSNLIIGFDDNTGSYISSSASPQFYVYSTNANRALRIYSDGTNYNPASPSSYSGTYVTSNNQIMLSMTTTTTSSSGATLAVTPNTLQGFTYVVNNGPSAVKSFAVIGADLTNPVTITAPSHYEISTSENGTYGSTITLGGSKSGSQTWGFDGSFENWTTIDADGDGYNWKLASELMSGSSIPTHSGSNMLTSESYNQASYAALTPDNWLVSPAVSLGGTFTMYACAQDANYAAEHFGIYVSTSSSTNTSSFVKLNEWTLSAKGTRTQGAWREYTVDLSAYVGRTGYIAVRHFNCNDQFYLNVDDFTLTYSETPSTPSTPTVSLDFLATNVYVRLKSGCSQGTYNETLTVTSGNLSSTVSLKGTVTGSKMIENNETLSVYPNPVEKGENFRIEIPADVELDNAIVEVFDILGNRICSEQVQGNSSIERSISTAAGLYTVRVVDSKGKAYFGKLIVR